MHRHDGRSASECQEKQAKRTFPARLAPSQHAGSGEDGTASFRMPQKNAMVRSNQGPSGESWLMCTRKPALVSWPQTQGNKTMKSNFATSAGLFASLTFGALSVVGFAGAAQAAPGGGGTCIPDHVYHQPTTYQVPQCTCPSGSLRHTNSSNGDYWCTYPQHQTIGPARELPRRQLPKLQEGGSVTPK